MADGLYYTTVCGMADTPAGGGHPGGRRTGGHPGGRRTGGHPGGHYSTVIMAYMLALWGEGR